MKPFLPLRLPLILILLSVAAWLAAVGGPASALDRRAMVWLADLRPGAPGLTTAAIGLTWIGSVYGTLGSTAIAAGWQSLFGARRTAIWLIATVGGGRLIGDGLKLLVDRPRPDLTPWPVPVSSLSFPSGHAMNTMVAFTALAFALAAPRWRRPAVAGVILMSLMIGATRPYLGVHWASDVIAGWCLGGALLLAAAPLLRPSAGRTSA